MEESYSTTVKTLQELKHALLQSFMECNERRLLHSANWASELANSLLVPLESVPQVSHSSNFVSEFASYSYATSLFDMREYRRASHVLNDCQSVEGTFLKLYSLYLAGEKIKEDEIIEVIGDQSTTKSLNPFLLDIKSELSLLEGNKCLDGFGYYLYGIVERELGQNSAARERLVQACHLNPLIWSAWEDLTHLCTNREMLNSLELPNHWMKDFYLAAGSLQLLLVEDALAYYSHLGEIGFSSSNYIGRQLALVHYHLKDFEQSAVVFQSVRERDPYSLNAIDVYSHVLFVMEKLQDLYQLAIDVDSIDKYRSETCSVIGNFYSLNGDHEKACAYFKRGIKMDKSNHTSWILLGHEYLELKNHTLAIEAYTNALDSNKNDFRIYYGLGHAYELLTMPYFAISYYKMAYNLQPSDSRVLHALGYCYDMLEQYDSAKKCYKKAITFPNPEGPSILKLAKLHIKLEEEECAAKLYAKFLTLCERNKIVVNYDEGEEGCCHLFLARYNLRRGQHLEAEAHAHKAMLIVETREEGKSVLQEIYKFKTPAVLQQSATDLAELVFEHNSMTPLLTKKQ